MTEVKIETTGKRLGSGFISDIDEVRFARGDVHSERTYARKTVRRLRRPDQEFEIRKYAEIMVAQRLEALTDPALSRDDSRIVVPLGFLHRVEEEGECPDRKVFDCYDILYPQIGCGETLQNQLERKVLLADSFRESMLTRRELVSLIRQFCTALEIYHFRLRLVNRDLNTGNLLNDETGYFVSDHELCRDIDHANYPKDIYNFLKILRMALLYHKYGWPRFYRVSETERKSNPYANNKGLEQAYGTEVAELFRQLEGTTLVTRLREPDLLKSFGENLIQLLHLESQ